MEYIFVYKNRCWWLKINTLDQLFDYYEKTDSKWSKAFSNLIHSKEFGKGMEHADTLAFNIGFYGTNRNMNAIEAAVNFRNEIFENQLAALLQYREIYINKNGGYHWACKEDAYEQFVRRTELIFPEYEEKDIRIKRFPAGQHFYAYIGDMQIKDGDALKWNTYEEAYNIAQKYVSNRKRKESPAIADDIDKERDQEEKSER